MNKQETFWRWFSDNHEKYLSLDTLTEYDYNLLMDDLLSHLHEYSDNIFFQIGADDNSHELIITAEGNAEHFNDVELLVDSAPYIPNWDIIAFKPALGVNVQIDYKGLTLKPKNLWFLPLDNEQDTNKLGLRICIDNFDSNNEQEYLEGVYQVLDAVLGEKSSALDIDYVEVNGLPTNPEEYGLIELSELKEYIKWRKTKLEK